MIFTLASNVTFGKYKNRPVQDVMDTDPNYFEWCIDNIEWFNLDQEAERYMKARVDEVEMDGRTVKQ